MTVTEQTLAPIDRGALIRDAIRFSSLIAALVCAIAGLGGALLGTSVAVNFAISVAIGTVLGLVNFVLLARGVGGAIDRTVAGIERTQQLRPTQTDEGLEPEDVLDRPRNAGGSLRLALVILLVAGVLWVQPTQPAGLAIGIVITLIGASVAAYRLNSVRAP